MSPLDDIRAEWIQLRKSLESHIAFLEAGNKIRPIGQDPDQATDEFIQRLKRYRAEVTSWLATLPSEAK